MARERITQPPQPCVDDEVGHDDAQVDAEDCFGCRRAVMKVGRGGKASGEGDDAGE